MTGTTSAARRPTEGGALLIALLTIVTLAGPAHALPDDPEARKQIAREAYAEGMKRAQAGEYEAAVAAFERAYAAVPKAAFLFNIAAAYETWGGHCADALRTYERFFTACGDCPQREAAESRRARLYERCTAEVTVSSVPAGADLEIDGEARGRAPATLRLVEGPHVIVARLEGHPTHEKAINVKAGQPMNVALALASPPPAAAPPAAGRLVLRGVPPGAVVELDGRPAEGTELEVPAEATTPVADEAEVARGGAGPWPWVAFGVGGAGLAAGIVLSVQAAGQRDARDAASSLVEAREHHDSMNTLNNWSLAGYGVAAAGIATGALLLVLDDDEDEPTAWGPAVGPGYAGVAGRF